MGEAGFVGSDNSENVCLSPDVSISATVAESFAVTVSSYVGLYEVMLSLGMFSVIKVEPASDGVIVEVIKFFSVVVSGSPVFSAADRVVTVPVGFIVVMVSVVVNVEPASSVASGVVVVVVVGGKLSPEARPTSYP
jgi:hypothetical protein